MIKNIVFDVNGVLLKFNFIGCLDVFDWTPRIKQQITDIIFKSELGTEFFEGKIGSITFYKELLKNFPKRKGEIKQIFQTEFLAQLMPPDYDTFEFLKQLKSDYNIFILSNMDFSMAKYFENVFGINDHINGALYAYEVGLRKPNPEIFKTFIEKYDIDPNETVYIDDSSRNAKTAETLGFKSFVFRNSEITIPQIKFYLNKDMEQKYIGDDKIKISLGNIQKPEKCC